MGHELPQESEIRKSVEDLFAVARERSGAEILSALVPVMDLPVEDSTNPMIPVAPDLGMGELCSFVNQFKSYLKTATDSAQTMRLQAAIYCHIMEADFPYLTFWNLLRVIMGQRCEWRISKETKSGKHEVLDGPTSRIPAIECLSSEADLKIGETLSKLWVREFRNGFSHSGYTFGWGGFSCLDGFTPGTKRPGKKPWFCSEQDVADLNAASQTYLRAFIHEYMNARKPFENEQPHRIQDGTVQWDTQGESWDFINGPG